MSSALKVPEALQFLQKEYKRFDSERGLWELEKSEYQNKMATLEAVKKSHEKIVHDLLRRVKMMEFALRQERNKNSQILDFVKSNAKDLFTLLESTLTALPLAKTPEEAPQDAVPSPITKNMTGQLPVSSEMLRKYLEDLNSSEVWSLFAKSSEAVSQALQTPPTPVPLLNFNTTLQQQQDGTEVAKPVPELVMTPHGEKWKPTPRDVDKQKRDNDAPHAEKPEQAAPSKNNTAAEDSDDALIESVAEQYNISQKDLKNLMRKGESIKGSGSLKKVKFDSWKLDDKKALDLSKTPAVMNTKMLDELKNVDTKQDKKKKTPPPAPAVEAAKDESVMATLEKLKTNQEAKTFKSKASLYSHLDSVRSVVFHETESFLVTGSEDATIKLWNLGHTNKSSVICDPVHTYRGHTGMVLSVACGKNHMFSASADSTIMMWDYASLDSESYVEHGKAVPYLKKRITGHSDSIWSLSLHQTEPTLLTASSDDTVKLWNYEKDDPLVRTFELSGATPTYAAFMPSSPNRCLVSYADSKLVLFDMETSKPVWELATGTSPSSLIYQFACHPSLPLAVTAHEDKHIRFIDLLNGKVISELVAHKDAVSCISIDPSGLYVMTGSHDSNVRFWDLVSKHCIQDISVTHRKKFDEAVHSVAYHASKPFVASAGADSIVKIYS